MRSTCHERKEFDAAQNELNAAKEEAEKWHRLSTEAASAKHEAEVLWAGIRGILVREILSGGGGM